MKLKILHFVPYLTKGGVANVWINLTKSLARLGHDIYLVGPFTEHLKKYVVHHVVPRTFPGLIRDPLSTIVYTAMNAKLLKNIIREEGIDVILSHGSLAAACLYGISQPNTPFFTVVHGTYTNEVKWIKHHPKRNIDRLRYILGVKLMHSYEIASYRLSSLRGIKFIAVSEKTVEELACMKVTNIYKILNGVDKELFRPIDREKARELLERKYKIKLRGFIISQVGLAARKGTHILIHALAALRKRKLAFTALLVGKIAHKTYENHLRKLIVNFGLSDNIILMGHVPDELLPYIYNASDLVVVPSYSEGSPLVIPESLACGTPVVATDVGGNPEYLKLVELEDLLVEIDKYDFAAKLFLKLSKVLDDIDKYRLKTLGNMHRIPSWIDVALEYSKLFTLTSGSDGLQ